MRRAELNPIEPSEPTIGAAEAVLEDEDGHTSHTFLYVPDLESRTGWVSHRVPERQGERTERRPMGFRR